MHFRDYEKLIKLIRGQLWATYCARRVTFIEAGDLLADLLDDDNPNQIIVRDVAADMQAESLLKVS